MSLSAPDMDTLKLACRTFLEECKCSLCTDLWKKASSFPCGHTFCYDCAIATLEGPGISQSECPTCKQKYWKRDLKPNPQLMAAVEHAQKIMGIAGHGWFSARGSYGDREAASGNSADRGPAESDEGEADAQNSSPAACQDRRSQDDPGEHGTGQGAQRVAGQELEAEAAAAGGAGGQLRAQQDDDDDDASAGDAIASLGAGLRRSNPGNVAHVGQCAQPQPLGLAARRRPQSTPSRPHAANGVAGDERHHLARLRPESPSHGPGRLGLEQAQEFPASRAAPPSPAAGGAHLDGRGGGGLGLPEAGPQRRDAAAARMTAFAQQPADLVFTFHTGHDRGGDLAAPTLAVGAAGGAVVDGVPAAQPQARPQQRPPQPDPNAGPAAAGEPGGGAAAAAAGAGAWGTPRSRTARHGAPSGGPALVPAGTMTTPHVNLLPQPRSQPMPGWPTPSHGRPAVGTDCGRQRPGSVVSIRRGTPSVNNAYLQFHSLLEEAVSAMAQEPCVVNAGPDAAPGDDAVNDAAAESGGVGSRWAAFDEATWHHLLAALPGPTEPEREALEFELSVVNNFLEELEQELARVGTEAEAGAGRGHACEAGSGKGRAAARTAAAETAVMEPGVEDVETAAAEGDGLGGALAEQNAEPPPQYRAPADAAAEAQGLNGRAAASALPPNPVLEAPAAPTLAPGMVAPAAAVGAPAPVAGPARPHDGVGARAASLRGEPHPVGGGALAPNTHASDVAAAPALSPVGGAVAASRPPSPRSRYAEEEGEAEEEELGVRPRHKRPRTEVVSFNAGKQRSCSPQPLVVTNRDGQHPQDAPQGDALVAKNGADKQARGPEVQPSAGERPPSQPPPSAARPNQPLEADETDDAPAPMLGRRRAPPKRYRSEPPRPPPAPPAPELHRDGQAAEPRAGPLLSNAHRGARKGRARERDSGAAAAAAPTTAATAAANGAAAEGAAAGGSVRRGKPAFILATGLSGPDKTKLKELSRRVRGVELLEDVLPQMTHLVVKLTPQGRAGVRTVKYLRAVLQGCWVVGVEWAEACLAAGRLVPEGPYEATGDPVHEGTPALCRTRVERNEPPLFSGVAFCVNYLTAAGKVPRSDVEALLLAAGGRIVRRPPSRPGGGPSGGGTLAAVLFGSAAGDMYDRTQPSQQPTQQSLPERDPAAPPLPPGFPPVVVLLANMDNADASRVVREWGYAPILRDWVFDSVSHFRVLPLEGYAVAPESQQEMTESSM